MPIPLGEDAVIEVGAADTLGTQVLGINAWDAPSARSETVRKYFMMAPVTFVGAPEDTVQLSGDYNKGDTGQALIRTNYRSGVEMFVGVMPDGTNGFSLKSRVSQSPNRGPSPDDPPAAVFNFVGTDAPANVGTGL